MRKKTSYAGNNAKRISVSVPAGLRLRMTGAGDVNWSKLAQETWERFLLDNQSKPQTSQKDCRP